MERYLARSKGGYQFGMRSKGMGAEGAIDTLTKDSKTLRMSPP